MNCLTFKQSENHLFKRSAQAAGPELEGCMLGCLVICLASWCHFLWARCCPFFILPEKTFGRTVKNRTECCHFFSVGSLLWMSILVLYLRKPLARGFKNRTELWRFFRSGLEAAIVAKAISKFNFSWKIPPKVIKNCPKWRPEAPKDGQDEPKSGPR